MRPPLEARVKDLLDETRLTLLGAQVLLGMQFRGAFNDRFDALPAGFRWLHGVALLLILAASAFLLATPTFHQIAFAGHASGRMLDWASGNLKAALLPIAVALGLDVAISLVHELGAPWALIAGAVFALGASAGWYLVPAIAHRSGHRGEREMEEKRESLEARIVQALTELRVILPGAQALFGFQFIAVLTASFDKLPAISHAVHLVSFGLVAVAIILLVAPAAYHRIAAGGDAEERVLRYAAHMMIAAVGLLAAGMAARASAPPTLIRRTPSSAMSRPFFNSSSRKGCDSNDRVCPSAVARTPRVYLERANGQAKAAAKYGRHLLAQRLIGGRSFEWLAPEHACRVVAVESTDRAGDIDGGQFVFSDAAKQDLLLPVLRIEEPGAIPHRERDGEGPVLRPDVEHREVALTADAVHLAVLGDEGAALLVVLDLVSTGQEFRIAAEEL